MILFQFLLMFHLSYQIENRFIHLEFSKQQNESSTSCSPFGLVKFVIDNLSFIVLLLVAAWNLRDIYLFYSWVSILFNPLKLWMPLIAIYLRYKCVHLTAADFERFIDSSKLRSANSQRNHETQQLLNEAQANQFFDSSSSSYLSKDS